MLATVARQFALALLLALTFAPLAAAIEVSPEDAEALKSAQAAYDAGKYADAVKLLAPLRAKYPDEADIPRMLAHAWFELGDFDAARQSALAAIAAGRLSSDLLGRIAQIDQRRDDRIAVLNAVRLLTFVEPGNRQWRLVYADLLAAAGSLDEGAAVYRELFAEQPASADVAFRLGNVLVKQERFAAAATALETAWRLGAADPRLPLVIAGAWQSLGDDRQALAWIERASAVAAKPDPQLVLQAAQIQFQLGDLDRAAATANPLVASAADAPAIDTPAPEKIRSHAHVLLGRIATAQGNVGAAIAHWRQAVQSGNDSEQLLAVLGAHYYNAGDYATAAKVLRRVVEGGSKRGDAEGDGSASESTADEQVLRFLVASLLRCGDAAAARDFLRQYIERHGLNDEAKSLVRALATANVKP
jgi:tetratricopeptide (TPR) repeat protein